jgi:hypothetical protein
VALAVRRIVEAILRDESSILTVSSLLEGEYGMEHLCLSLPCVVSGQGVDQPAARAFERGGAGPPVVVRPSHSQRHRGCGKQSMSILSHVHLILC